MSRTSDCELFNIPNLERKKVLRTWINTTKVRWVLAPGTTVCKVLQEKRLKKVNTLQCKIKTLESPFVSHKLSLSTKPQPENVQMLSEPRPGLPALYGSFWPLEPTGPETRQWTKQQSEKRETREAHVTGTGQGDPSSVAQSWVRHADPALWGHHTGAWPLRKVRLVTWATATHFLENYFLTSKRTPRLLLTNQRDATEVSFQAVTNSNQDFARFLPCARLCAI